MYDENDVEIPSQTAGLLLAAILSDTLAFRSPTCTAVDVNAANRLAGIAGEGIGGGKDPREKYVAGNHARYQEEGHQSWMDGWSPVR